MQNWPYEILLINLHKLVVVTGYFVHIFLWQKVFIVATTNQFTKYIPLIKHNIEIIMF